MYVTHKGSPKSRSRARLWLLVGLLSGALSVAIGALAARSTQGVVGSTSPAPAVDAGVVAPPDPGLRFECRNSDDCVRTSEVDWKDKQGALWRKFLRVRVYNDGPRTAQGCKVALAGVEELTPNGPIPTDYDGSGLLIWSGDSSANPQGRNIRGNANPEVADLFYTVHHPSGDKIYLKDERYGSFLKFGRWYDFEVVATARGGRSVSHHIKVRFGAVWDDFEVVGD